MLLIPTGATIKAINVSKDWHHPFHTYNNHNDSYNMDSHNKTSQLA